MFHSRFGRLEERKARKRLILALVGMVGIVVFLLLFGIKLLIWFSLLVDKSKGPSLPAQITQTIMLPPVLDPLPIATNSATQKITGSATVGTTAIIYVNETEFRRVKVGKDGTFHVSGTTLKEGENTISAKMLNDKGDTSDLSNVLQILVKKSPPRLDISDPADNSTVNGDNNRVTVNGITDEQTTVTINDRLVVVHNDGSFSYEFPLSEGDNQLKITATDAAGNQTTVERKVAYHK